MNSAYAPPPLLADGDGRTGKKKTSTQTPNATRQESKLAFLPFCLQKAVWKRRISTFLNEFKLFLAKSGFSHLKFHIFILALVKGVINNKEEL